MSVCNFYILYIKYFNILTTSWRKKLEEKNDFGDLEGRSALGFRAGSACSICITSPGARPRLLSFSATPRLTISTHQDTSSIVHPALGSGATHKAWHNKIKSK